MHLHPNLKQELFITVLVGRLVLLTHYAWSPKKIFKPSLPWILQDRYIFVNSEKQDQMPAIRGYTFCLKTAVLHKRLPLTTNGTCYKLDWWFRFLNAYSLPKILFFCWKNERNFLHCKNFSQKYEHSCKNVSITDFMCSSRLKDYLPHSFYSFSNKYLTKFC